MPPPPNSDYREIAQGSSVTYEFNENAATGYVWECSQHAGLDISSRYEPSQPVMVGSGGKRVFEIVAKEDGLYELEFQRKRPTDTVAAETQTVKLSVKPWI